MKLQARPSDPLINDRWVDVAFIVLWTVYALWGLMTFFTGLPTVNMLTPDWYQTAWSGAIGSLSLVACISALLVFFHTPHIHQVTKKRTEFGAVLVLCLFILVYPVLLVIRAAQGDVDRVGGTAVVAWSFLIFPILRLHLLRGRTKRLREPRAT